MNAYEKGREDFKLKEDDGVVCPYPKGSVDAEQWNLGWWDMCNEYWEGNWFKDISINDI